VRNLTDSSGAVTDRYVTTAFGKLVSSTGSTTNPYRFGGAVGYYQDDAQRYYVRKRYLNTNQARWISPDPIGFNGKDWNLYRYVGNNPGNRIDPTGLKVCAKTTKYQHRMCGFEVGWFLNAALKRTTATFRSWTEDQRLNACAYVIDVTSAHGAWDIQQLNTSSTGGTASTSTLFQGLMGCYSCATRPCGQTVSIYNSCYHMWAVNYALFGTIFRLCGSIPNKDSVRMKFALNLSPWPALVCGAPHAIKNYFSEDSAKCLVRDWNYIKSLLDRHYQPEDVKEKLAWMEVGYSYGKDGNISAHAPQGKALAYCRNCCNASYQTVLAALPKGKLEVQWGTHSI
jgi:RHS repeat-associated protein